MMLSPGLPHTDWADVNTTQLGQAGQHSLLRSTRASGHTFPAAASDSALHTHQHIRIILIAASYVFCLPFNLRIIYQILYMNSLLHNIVVSINQINDYVLNHCTQSTIILSLINSPRIAVSHSRYDILGCWRTCSHSPRSSLIRRLCSLTFAAEQEAGHVTLWPLTRHMHLMAGAGPSLTH